MTTNSDKLRAYYAKFDEWSRLESPDGALEFAGALRALAQYLPVAGRVLDLGGGPGRYSIELARHGHRVVLADLSPALLEVARGKFEQAGVGAAIESVDEINALDLARYSDASFDAVLAFGPFYHLLSHAERLRAAQEIVRVVRPLGMVFVAYMPRLSGLVGLIERAAVHPEQVSAEVLRQAADTGIFRNQALSGFQEAYYPLPNETETLFTNAGVRVVTSLSLRSILNGLGAEVSRLAPEVRQAAEAVAVSLNRDPAVLARSGHVLLVAKRNPRQEHEPKASIRRATPHDIDAILACDSEKNAPGRPAFVRSSVEQHQCWLAEQAGQVLGFVVLEYSFFGNGFVSLLLVREDSRRRGTGSALFSHALASCSTPKVFSSTNESNLPMRSLLAKLGFRASGVIENLDAADAELVFFRQLPN